MPVKHACWLILMRKYEQRLLIFVTLLYLLNKILSFSQRFPLETYGRH